MPKRKETSGKSKMYRQYTRNDITQAARLFTEEGMSVYQAAKSKNIPWSSLKWWIQNVDSKGSEMNLSKLGKPFALSFDLELRIVRYITEMQELGFGLTAQQARALAYKVASILVSIIRRYGNYFLNVYRMLQC